MAINKLTTKQVDNAKPRDRTYKLADGAGLYLEVRPNGSRYWRGKYRHGGKEKLNAYGVFPIVGLEEVRRRHAAALALLRDGVDPVAAKKVARLQQETAATQTLEHIGREWIERERDTLSPATTTKREAILSNHLFPRLGNVDVRAITAPILLAEIRKIEELGILEIVSRVRRYASAIFRFAIATGRADIDPAAPLKDALKTRQAKHHASVPPAELGKLMRMITEYESAVVRLALRITMLTSLRTIEVRAAAWSEIDLRRAEWTVPAERMKMRLPHWIPLSRQAVEALRELQQINGHRALLFPNERKPAQPMSENTMLYALHRSGYHKRATVHGFRTSMSTTMNELGYKSDIIETQLAHTDPNQVRGTYNKAEYERKRRKLVQDWADILDKMEAGTSWDDIQTEMEQG